MEAPVHIHRPSTIYKQRNKPFKSGRHASKSEQTKRRKGELFPISFFSSQRLLSEGRVGQAIVQHAGVKQQIKVLFFFFFFSGFCAAYVS
jgi:hypothetical protein